jgi:ankyrin repeat protein
LPATPTANPGPAVAAAPDEPTRAAFFQALERNDEGAALAMLAKTPALANAHTPRGTSAYFAALGRIVGKGFLRPQDNRVAAAVLALHPELDAFDAAAAGDAARVRQELAADPSYVTRVHRLGWTPLHFAAFGGQPQIVELLLARGAAVDAVARNHFANTPLLVGLLTRQGEVARVLLAHRADVNFKQGEGVTALHEAAQSGDLDVVHMLLDAGADPDARTGKLDDGTSGRTALDLAREAGHDDVVTLLLSRGARGSSNAQGAWR